ncbi:integrase [Pseudoscardovia radai]|uniref:Integrase n=2 Tax=Pseudoscardovia radai TaxID=987066 RepID=A0A261EWI4_9BIFI|nr:site-specific integrase [Pseudoscardovia radai]OZG51224.1 integrase [Pseudoscardovia radai]
MSRKNERPTRRAGISRYDTAGGVRYIVYYRGADRRQHSKSGFRRILDAERFRDAQKTDARRGVWVDPVKSRARIDDYGARVVEIAAGTGKPSHARDIESAWRVHVAPKWGSMRLGDVTHTQVQAWVNSLVDGTAETARGRHESASVTLRAFGVLKSIFDAAVRDGMTARNPCDRCALPRKTRKPRTYLTPRQVIALADASGRYRALILTLGFCGLRIGEARALRVRNVDAEAGRLAIEKSMSRANGWKETEPKTWERRTVPVPAHVMRAIVSECQGKAAGDLVFTEPDGKPLAEPKRSGGWFGKAIAAAGVPSLTVHDLRHTAASIAISSHANVKAVQRMLGHKNASMTLDTYADLFSNDLDEVAADIDRRISDVLAERPSCEQSVSDRTESDSFSMTEKH